MSEDEKIISLLMLSGGLDSAWALVKLLKETDDEVLVHHMHLITDFRREEPEKQSCQKIVEYCRKHYRPFTYSETAIDHRGMSSHGIDLIAAGFTAGVVAASYFSETNKHIDRWIVGISTEDRVPLRRFIRADNVCRYNCQSNEPPTFYKFPPVSQQEIIDTLPVDLYELTWSCRQPVITVNGYKPCGSCATCERLAPYTHREHQKKDGVKYSRL